MAGLNRRLHALERLFGPAMVELTLEEAEAELDPQVAVPVQETVAAAARCDPEAWAERTKRVAETVDYLEWALANGIDVPKVGNENEVRQTIRRLLRSCSPPLGPFCTSCDDWMPGLQFDGDGSTRCRGCGDLVGWLPPLRCDYFGHRQPCHCGYDPRDDLTERWFWPLLEADARQLLITRYEAEAA